MLILLLSAFITSAQDKNSEKSNSIDQKKEIITQDKPTKNDEQKFIDINGDGIKDKVDQNKGQKGNRKSDKFIDKDGDGINDSRCQGLGWGNKGKIKMYGKRGK